MFGEQLEGALRADRPLGALVAQLLELEAWLRERAPAVEEPAAVEAETSAEEPTA